MNGEQELNMNAHFTCGICNVSVGTLTDLANNLAHECFRQFENVVIDNEACTISPQLPNPTTVQPLVPVTTCNRYVNVSGVDENVEPTCLTSDKLWTDARVLLFLTLMKKYDDDFHKSLKKFVWQKIAIELTKQTNVQFSSVQVDSKWKSLLKTYKDITEINKTSGKSPKKWKYYDVVHEIVFRKPEINPVATCSSYSGLKLRDNCTLGQEENSNSSTSSTSITSSPYSSVQSSFMVKRKTREDAVEKRHKEKMSKLDDLTNILNRMVDVMEQNKN